jgi:hypothetical protein
MMSNKPHQRPHQNKQASRITRLLVWILIVGIFALVIALEATGHIIFRGRLNPVMRGRWLSVMNLYAAAATDSGRVWLIFCCLPLQRAAGAAVSSRAPMTPGRSGVPGSHAIVICNP